MSGFSVPFIVGTTLGRDHIEWPTETQAEKTTIMAPNNLLEPYKTGLRASLTLEQMLAVCGRVQEWSFSGGWSATGTFGGPAVSGSSLIENTPSANRSTLRTAYPNSAVIHETSREIDLASEELAANPFALMQYSSDLGFPRRNYGFISPLTSAGLFGHLRMRHTATTVANTDVEVNTFPFTLLLADNRFNPEVVTPGGSDRGIDIVVFDPIGKTFSPIFGFTDLIGFFGFGFFDCRTTFGALTQNASFTIDPVVAPSFTVPLTIGPLNGIILTGSFCNIKMTASKFLPYVNTLGQAIYDATTGAPTGADPFA